MGLIEDIISFSTEHWYLYLGLVILFIYSKYKDNEKVGDLSLNQMYLIVEIGFIFLIIYFIQTKLFYGHYFFLFAIPIFILMFGWLINYLLSLDDVYLLESALGGEEFNDLVNGKKVMSLTTRLRLFRMDRNLYNTKLHIGDSNNPLLNVSRRIKFADYVDLDSGIIYHSEYPELQNINLFTQTATFLKLKKDIPELIKENIVHTFLDTWKVARLTKTLTDNKFKYELKAIKDEIEKEPFTLFKSMDEMLEYVQKMKTYESEKENTISEKEIGNTEIEVSE